jgi:hypothetical protein
MRSFHCLKILALPESNSFEASSRKDGGFESLTTVFFTGLTMAPKKFESLISGTVEKSTAESPRADGASESPLPQAAVKEELPQCQESQNAAVLLS